MAHIQKRGDGRWRARYRAPDGRERSKTFSRKVDAEHFLTSVENAKLSGSWTDPKAGKTSFEAFALEWLQSVSGSDGTMHNIEGRVRNHLVPYFGRMPLNSIKASDVRKWIASMTQKNLAPSTIKSTYWTLRRILETAVADDIIPRTPCRGIEAGKDLPKDRGRKEMRFLSPDEVVQLASHIDERYEALIFTAAYTGARWGELAALKVDRLNLLKGTMEIRESLSERKGHVRIGPTKTGKIRTVSLPGFLAEMLGQHIGRFPSPEGFVFSAAEGGPLRRAWYDRHFQPAVERSGIGRMRFHDLRHTCAGLLIARGAHVKEIAERLGHSTIRLTLDTYGHLLPSLDDRLREGLEATYQEALAASPRPETENESVGRLDRKRKTPGEQGFSEERATRFELATLTLAR